MILTGDAARKGVELRPTEPLFEHADRSLVAGDGTACPHRVFPDNAERSLRDGLVAFLSRDLDTELAVSK